MGRQIPIFVSLYLLGCLTGLSGCAPDLGEVPFLCNNGTPRCPSGYECKVRYCVKEGTCPEMVPGCTTPATCGNGACDVGEDEQNCSQDCKGGNCGNGTCDAGETAKSCPKDCHCGDGTCGTEETPASCPEDCPVSTCGDGKCLSPETVKSCPEDCPPVCGDGTCDLGENSQSCPKDCPAGVCGDKKCDPGETETSCPTDCGTSCTDGTTQCEGADKLKSCVAGTWKTDDCNAYCTAGGYNYSTGCQYSSTQKKDVCLCGKYVGFGSVCDDTKKCDPATLFCGVFGTSSKGFCTKYCTSSCSGAPAGTYASCSVSVAGKSACVFECDFFTFCPSALTCDFFAGICKP